MISLTNRVRLPVPPARVWECFLQMDEHYHEWIPEHLAWRWLRGEPLSPGSLWHADEWVGPMRINTRFQIIDSDPERGFSFRILGFPYALGRTAGSFRFNRIGDDGCDLVQEVHFGFSVPLLGQLIDVVLRLLLPVAEFRRHQREEGDGFARLLEPAPDRAA
jgi:uncharacterized protein YndB with AHSA1/START domain